MQRLDLNAERNAPLVATFSARALIMRLPMEGSFAHEGTRPQRIDPSRRVEPSEDVAITRTCWVGATL